MTILVSPNEREEVMKALGELGFETPLGFDFMLFTARGIVVAERKFNPNDLLASLRDGRLAKECAAMREASEFRFVILEGELRFTLGNMLRIGGKPSSWSKSGIRNLYRSIRFVEGCDLEFSTDILDTVEVLKELQGYFDETSHLNIRRRPRFESNWAIPTYEERFTWWLQGCGPGISIIRARAIAKAFKSPMEIASAFMDDTLTERMIAIPGIGPKIVDGVIKFWRGGI